MYEGGLEDDLKVDVNIWRYFELVGVLKELGYEDFDKIYYKDPQFVMNALVDDKGALDIAGLYRVHQSVDIYIHHMVSQPDYFDGPVDNVDEGSDNIVYEVEE